MANNGEKGKNSGSKDNNFSPGAKNENKSMLCKLKTQGAESNTDRGNLSRASGIALIGSEDAQKGHALHFWVGKTSAR
jgi:hypothetical protein